MGNRLNSTTVAQDEAFGSQTPGKPAKLLSSLAEPALWGAGTDSPFTCVF